MKKNQWRLSDVLIYVACWTTTISVTFYWIYLYSLDEDVIDLEYREYYHEDSDRYPMLSLCFKSPFNNSKLESMNTKHNATSYLEFLKGTHFSKEMFKYDYHSMIFDISEYVVNYWSRWKNETTKLFSPTDCNIVKSTFAGFWHHRFYNCYGLQIKDDEQLQHHSVLLKNDIFPSNVRPRTSDFFTLLHYPNHLLRSLRSIRFSWPQRTTNDTYGMLFTVNEVEVIKRRNKNKQPCNENWSNHDEIVQKMHSKMVGCRTPYHNTTSKTKKCSTMEEMKTAQFTLRFDEYGNIPPCKAMEQISYSYKEIEYSNTKWKDQGKFWVNIRIGSPNFKEIVHTR